VYGDEFPFHDAAFIGGRPSERGLPRERYAGDASLYGTAELRVPVAKFTVLLPFDTGIYVYGDAGRVYVNGDSPGGWHTTTGVGAWVGILSSAYALTVESNQGSSGLEARIGLSF
jgi:hemolysin activation/secretion protein